MPARSIASATASEAAARRRRSAAVAVALSAALLSDAGAQSTGGAGSANAKAAPAKAAPARAGAAKAASAPAADGQYGQRFASLCAACHGPEGRSEMPGTPVLAGQHGFYAITQLFLFREGRRANEAMTAVAKTLKDDDLRGFSSYIDTLAPAPPVPATTPVDAARMARGQALAQQHRCVMCHGTDLAGGQQVPRIAGQREEYLRDTLRGFKSGTRPGYTMAMIEAVGPVTPEELDVLAYYAAHFGAPAAPGK